MKRKPSNPQVAGHRVEPLVRHRAMTLSYAVFCFSTHDEHTVVTFDSNYDGKPSIVIVNLNGVEHRVDNRDGRYKPCLTHAKELVQMKRGKATPSNFAKRRMAAKPLLRLVSE